MQDPDSVHPDDALLQQVLASTADYIRDPVKKDKLLDFIMTAKPLAEWSKEELTQLLETSTYIASWTRMRRELDTLTGPDVSGHQPDNETRDR